MEKRTRKMTNRTGLTFTARKTRSIFYGLALALAAFSPAAHATVFTFDTDPFAGTPVLTAPGRQIVGGEDFISFNPAQDLFSINSTVFGVGTTVNFVNATAGALPSTGVN